MDGLEAVVRALGEREKDLYFPRYFRLDGILLEGYGSVQEIQATMNLKDGWAKYSSFTAKASTVSRQLAFAGLGVIWLFRVTEQDGSQVIPPDFLLPALLIVLCLTFDLNQYVVAGVLWHRRLQKEERAQRKRAAEMRANDMRLDVNMVELDETEEFSVSKNLSRAIDRLWLLKIGLIYAAYALLFIAIIDRFAT